jgi:Cohesin domain.
LFPGEYDISLKVEDEFDLTDSITYPSLIKIDTVFGDVSWNGTAQAFDASIILKHLVDVQEMTPLQIEIGDVSRNDTLSTLDASLILQYSVGLIDELPVNVGNQYSGGGILTMMNQGIDPGMAIEIPINIENGLNIFGFKGGINYDADILTFDTLIFANQFSDYYFEYNMNNEGTIMVAAAGSRVDLNSGNFATIVFQVSEDFNNQTELNLIDWVWNDGQLLNTPVGMIITYGLDIEKGLIPDSFVLHQNYPNPFNPVTQIRYDLPEKVW